MVLDMPPTVRLPGTASRPWRPYIATPTSRVRGRYARGMLVGRHPECARLESLIGATRAGGGARGAAPGRAGRGKSALLDFAAERAGGLTVLRAGGIPGEAEVAFAGVLEVLRPVLHRLPELPAPQRDGARRGAGPRARRSSATASSWARPRSRCCSLASAERPVLACVDDVHWLDTPSLDALLFAGRRLAGAPVGMILAARDEPHPALDAARLEELPVPALDREATGLLASRLIGRSPDEAASRRSSAGRRGCRSRSRSGAGSARSRARGAPVPISSLVERAYARGGGAASEQVRALLLVAAADDSGDLATVLAAAERLGIPATAEEERGAARPHRGRGRPHPLPAPARALRGLPVAPRTAQAPRARGARGVPERRVAGRPARLAPRRGDGRRRRGRRRRARGDGASGHARAAATPSRRGRSSAPRSSRPRRERRAERAIAAADVFWLAGRGSRAEAAPDRRRSRRRERPAASRGRRAPARTPGRTCAATPPPRARSSWPGRCASSTPTAGAPPS